MPRANASNLAETLVSLAGETASTPTSGDTLETLTLGNGNGINNLILIEDGLDWDLLLKETIGIFDLISGSTTIDLDLKDVGLLLAEIDLGDLSVGDHTHNRAVLGDASKLTIDGLLTLGIGELLGVLGKGFLLRAIPVLVQTAEELLAESLSPDGSESTEAVRGLNVANNTNDEHGRSLNNGDSLNDFLLVGLGTSTVNLTDDVSHTSLVSKEGSKVSRL